MNAMYQNIIHFKTNEKIINTPMSIAAKTAASGVSRIYIYLDTDIH